MLCPPDPDAYRLGEADSGVVLVALTPCPHPALGQGKEELVS